MKKIKYTLILLVLVQTVWAQQNNSMYFMQTLSHSKSLNPAIQSEYKANVSGLLLLSPSMHLNYGSNTLTVDNILQYNSDLDSLVLPGYKGYDNQKLFNSLKKKNHLDFQAHLNVLSIAFKSNDWYIGFDINQKSNTRFSISKDLIRFALDGNAGEEFFGKTAHLGGLGINFTSYTEYGLSISKAINEKLTLGASVKLLMGQANIWTEKMVLDIHTSDIENYPMTLTADMLIHSSQPMIMINDLYYDERGDSLLVDTIHQKLKPVKSIFNTSNLGLGLDFGIIYKIGKKASIYASVTDLGYINWQNNAKSITMKGNFHWDGYDFQPDLSKDDETIEAHRDSIKNEMIKAFNPSTKSGGYSTSLQPKVYLGGTYKLGKRMKAGLLFRGLFYDDEFYPSVTLSGNFKLTRWFEAVASWSMINDVYNNVGVGFITRLGPIQLFMISDNALGVVIPQSTQNINLRMGINLAFGRQKKEEKKKTK